MSSPIEPGDIVRHWFSGEGTVQRVEGDSPNGTVWIKYDDGTTGGAYGKDLDLTEKPT